MRRRELPERTTARTWRTYLLRATLSVIFVACRGSEAGAPSGVVVRDSAGVEIVEHSAAFIAALPTWTVDSLPFDRIEDDSLGPADAQHGLTAVRDALQRADGRWVVADAKQRDIREYSAAGRFARILVGAGRGPGEVGMVERMQLLTGDSIAYVDPSNRRLSVLGPDGRFATQFLYPRFGDGANVRLIARLVDGRVLGIMRTPSAPEDAPIDSVFRKAMAIVAFRAAPATDSATAPVRVDTISMALDGEAYAATTTERGETWPDIYPLRFGRATTVGTDGTRIFIGTNAQNEIVEFSASGTVRRIRNGTAALPLTDADRTRFVSTTLAALDASLAGRDLQPTDRDDMRQNILRRRYATTFAFYSKLSVGIDGTLWVEQPALSSSDVKRFTVYDTAGRAVARAEFPSRMTPLRVSARDVLGTWLDDDDVPRVMRWRIVVR